MPSKRKTTATKEDAKPALVPKLRFPEFRGEEPWKDMPISSILTVRDERRVPSAESPLFSLTIENGITEKTDRYNREFLVRDTGNKKYKLVEPNDIVYNPSNLRWGAINYSQLSYSVVVSPIYEVLRLGDDSKYFLKFIACAVMRGEQISRFITKAQGTLVERIAVKIEDFLSTELPVPPTCAEQQKIAECLSSVDEVIAAQARKVDALKTHKKGLMQQLFPREGETQPRLRFSEFQNAGEWKAQRLSGQIDLISGMHLSPDDYSTAGEVPYFTGPSDFTDDLAKVSKWTNRSANVSQNEDTLITVKGSGVGEIWYSTLPEVAMGRQLMAIRSKNGSSRFMFQFLLTKRSRFEDLGSGNLIPGLSRVAILELEARFPKPAEQERIASCLSSLDALIAAETKKLEALKIHKKGLMQQLFPSPEEVAA